MHPSLARASHERILIRVQPCCVCKDEKSARDECMLFSNSSDPQDACKDLVGRYRSCMKGYGFDLP